MQRHGVSLEIFNEEGEKVGTGLGAIIDDNIVFHPCTNLGNVYYLRESGSTLPWQKVVVHEDLLEAEKADDSDGHIERMEHRRKMREFFGLSDEDPDLKGNMDEAEYTMSELGLWPDDIDSVSTKQMILCWRIVEKMRHGEFPDELRM